MIQFDLPEEQSSIIKVIGVGGGGSNAVNYMHSLGIDGVNFIVCNTDAQALALSKVPNKIQLGPSLTQGLGAGANPEIGRQATEESLDEIRRILEVNTKMAFVTAGMGGGTGTGGAPIISKICKDMGILTVGIITTPFSYEGKKRALHADSGIQEMKSQVDTLLVISNDKLRHQFGNLTMSAALSTADNVLATAAKCITDVINTTGQINVDFADVCTVMRNGGVAILGSARARGEDRAQVAIQQALNSPLLNDSDIKGAKWVLININSRLGDNEFTMDEVETIQEYLLTQAGPDADVILGLGYDESLGEEISITIIATGFDQKEAPGQPQPEAIQEPTDDRIMFTLDINPQLQPEVVSILQVKEQIEVDSEPLVEASENLLESTQLQLMDVVTIDEKLEPEQALILLPETVVMSVPEVHSPNFHIEEQVSTEEEGPFVVELDLTTTEMPVFASIDVTSTIEPITEVPKAEEIQEQPNEIAQTETGSFLRRPANIYVNDTAQESIVSEFRGEMQKIEEIPSPVEEVLSRVEEIAAPVEEVNPVFEMVYHDEDVSTIALVEEPPTVSPFVQEIAALDESEAQKARAEERLHKLRNLSFNFGNSDPNNEYENIPAYVRQNLQVHNTTLASVEKFYSSYAVGTDENNVTQISTINTFLEGKKPD